jgi:hypothetical protein
MELGSSSNIEGTAMLIRLGYEIAIDCPQPMPVISLLDINPDRQHDIKRQTRVQTTPHGPSSLYKDSFGNSCRRFMAPEGGFRILYDAVIEDSGETDSINTLALETPVRDLPAETLVFLLGSRYCATDHLGDLAWRRFGHLPQG